MVRPLRSTMWPHCNMMWPLCSMMWPLSSTVRPLCSMMWPLCNMVRPLRSTMWPHCNMMWPLCSMMWPLCNMVRPLPGMVWPRWSMEWPFCCTVWPLFRIVWLLFSMVWPQWCTVWPLSRIVWPIRSMKTPCRGRESKYSLNGLDLKHNNEQDANLKENVGMWRQDWISEYTLTSQALSLERKTGARWAVMRSRRVDSSLVTQLCSESAEECVLSTAGHQPRVNRVFGNSRNQSTTRNCVPESKRWSTFGMISTWCLALHDS